MRAFACLCLLLLTSCAGAEPADAVALEGETVTVACGICFWGLNGGRGCEWAVEIDGQHHLVQGKVPHGHVNHGPDGMCNMHRQAVLTGKLKGDRFVTSQFDLLPATDVPEKPRFTTEDH